MENNIFEKRNHMNPRLQSKRCETASSLLEIGKTTVRLRITLSCSSVNIHTALDNDHSIWGRAGAHPQI